MNLPSVGTAPFGVIPQQSKETGAILRRMAMLDAFLDGATGAGLFGKLRWPGAPTEFIDTRTVEEFKQDNGVWDGEKMVGKMLMRSPTVNRFRSWFQIGKPLGQPEIRKP